MSTIAHITARATQIQRRPDRVQLLTTAKVALAALLAATLVLPAAGGFHGQALWLRCIVYPAGLALVPAIRLVRRSGAAYPLAADTYLLVPFAFDACGNTLGLYGSVDNFDNIAHMVGTIALTGFAGSLLATRGGDRVLTVISAAGAAALFGIGIELAEWTAFTHPVATGYGAYRDTVGDLAMDVAGAALGAAALALRFPAP